MESFRAVKLRCFFCLVKDAKIKCTHKMVEHKKETLNRMNQLIVHRGPDDDGIYIDNTEFFSIGMAMRRLSIIDLNTGYRSQSQPINEM